MSAIINPYTVSGLVGLIFVALVVFKPQIGRVVLGIFFLLMALGVNIPVMITTPDLIVDLGKNAFIPFYRWAFTVLVAWNPRLWIIPVILYEIAVGVSILSKGRAVRWGALGGALFCLLVTPFGWEELTAPIIALALWLLSRCSFDRSLFEMVQSRFRRSSVKVSQI